MGARTLKVLTDTHTLVWALSEPSLLGRRAKRALSEAPFTASVANYWELVLKAGRPGALLADPVPWWERYVTGARIPVLAIRTAHIRALASLPELHKDPFDRILVGQALAENLTLLTRDEAVKRYGVPTLW